MLYKPERISLLERFRRMESPRDADRRRNDEQTILLFKLGYLRFYSGHNTCFGFQSFLIERIKFDSIVLARIGMYVERALPIVDIPLETAPALIFGDIGAEELTRLECDAERIDDDAVEVK